MSATLPGANAETAAEMGLPSPDVVAAFLQAHPEFLAERPELYRSLSPPRVRRGHSFEIRQYDNAPTGRQFAKLLNGVRELLAELLDREVLREDTDPLAGVGSRVDPP